MRIVREEWEQLRGSDARTMIIVWTLTAQTVFDSFGQFCKIDVC